MKVRCTQQRWWIQVIKSKCFTLTQLSIIINTIWFLLLLDARLSFGTLCYLWSVLAYLFFFPNVNWVWNQIEQYWNNSSVTQLLSCLTILDAVSCLTENTCWQYCFLNVCLHWQNKSCTCPVFAKNYSFKDNHHHHHHHPKPLLFGSICFFFLLLIYNNSGLSHNIEIQEKTQGKAENGITVW